MGPQSRGQGHAKAQFAVGMSYYSGKGLPEDHGEAYAWLLLAAAQGDETARDAANLLRQRLSPEELSKAETRVVELLAMIES